MTLNKTGHRRSNFLSSHIFDPPQAIKILRVKTRPSTKTKKKKKLLLFLSRNSRPQEHPHRNMFFCLTWKLIYFYIDKPYIGIVPNSYSCLTAQKSHIPKWASCLYIWKNRFFFFSGNLSRILFYVKALQEL